MNFDYCKGMRYTIQKGDTLYQISRKFRIPLIVLMKANPYADVYNLQIGEELCIPIKNGNPIPCGSKPCMPEKPCDTKPCMPEKPCDTKPWEKPCVPEKPCDTKPWEKPCVPEKPCDTKPWEKPCMPEKPCDMKPWEKPCVTPDDTTPVETPNTPDMGQTPGMPDMGMQPCMECMFRDGFAELDGVEQIF